MAAAGANCYRAVGPGRHAGVARKLRLDVAVFFTSSILPEEGV